MATIGIIAFSFALRNDAEPNPCNVRLAKAVERIETKLEKEGHKVIVIAQWEIARQLARDHEKADRVVHQLPDGKYLGSKEVLDAAVPVLKDRAIRTVVPVAQPFLHLFLVKRSIKAKGYEIRNEEIGHIGFDKKSDQWWTRSWWQLVIYSGLTILGYHGFNGQQK